MNLFRSRFSRCLVAVLLAALPASTAGAATWAQMWGNFTPGWSRSSSMKTADGGFITVGSSLENGTNVPALVKTDAGGNLVWARYLETGGGVASTIYPFNPLADGSYLVTGRGDLCGLWVVVFNAADTIIDQWSIPAGEVLEGRVSSNGQYLFLTWPCTNGMVVGKYDLIGRSFAWQQEIEGDYFTLEPTTDGGCILAGRYDTDRVECTLLKLSAAGQIVFSKRLRGPGALWGYGLTATSDGGFLLTGEVHDAIPGEKDVMVAKFTTLGAITWQKYLKKPGSDYSWDAAQVGSSFLVAAATHQNDPASASHDHWVIKLDGTGKITWQKRYLDYSNSHWVSILPLADGFLFAGVVDNAIMAFNQTMVVRADASGYVYYPNGSPSEIVVATLAQASNLSLGVTNLNFVTPLAQDVKPVPLNILLQDITYLPIQSICP